MSTNIEVSCTTCGTVNRIGEADVPAGAKFVPCVSCKSRVALPPMKASRNTPPPLPPIPAKGAGSAIGLADLPAPKRQSPLGTEPSRPAPKSALSEIELPAPKGGRQPAAAPITSSGSFDLDDLIPDNSAELPAPKTGRAPDVADLPVPRGAPTPVKSRAMTDLPMAAMPDVSDLPAPAAVKAAAARTPPTMPSVSDLPAPKARNLGGVSDLPAPVARNPAISDLPTPRNAGNNIVDLPAPKAAAAGGIVDLPTPRTDSDVPAPKGFFDDLPQPARAGSPTKNPDLPAPKGFFDDLPGKVSSSKPEVPAPKGFFDDLPGRVNAQKAAKSAQPEVPAPKGFFEDLPGRQNQSNAPQPPAPKGFFDDLPQPSSTQMAPPQPSATQSAPPKPVGKPVNTPVELDMSVSSASLDLGLASNNESSQARRFDDLDLSAPSTGIKFDAPKAAPAPIDDARARTPSVQPLPSFKKDKGQPATLELEEPRDVPMQSAKLAPKRKSEPSIDPDAARAKAKRVRVIALAGLFLVALGAGGFYFYRKWAAKRAVESTITEELAAAKDALGKSDRSHWDRAAGAAQRVIEANPKHAEALAIAAEARLASALADGQNYGGKLAQARANIQTAVSENIAGPNLLKAQALNAVTQSIGERALELLKPMATDPKDAQLQLYLGWGYAAAADPANAIKAFDAAANGTDFIKVCALYGRANAKLDQADLEGATADYKAVLALDKDHIGAQVGIAAALPASQSQQQEKDLLALFERKDFATGDPRAVVKAWSLAAEAAKRGGRLDAARERYRNALQIMGDDLGALAGAADVELRDGKLDAAADQVAKALAISKDDIRSQLVQSEISIAKGELADARARITALASRNPPPPKLDQARIKLAAGHLAEKESKDEEAAGFYAEAAELAGEADLTPTLAAVAKYTALADKADDQAKAEELRGKATKLLETLEAQAEKDPAIALALGSAYLRTGDAAKAEPWLRKFIEARADDPEGQFQIAKALAKLDKTEEAITRLRRAIELAPKRLELQIELARTHELAKQDDKAAEIYNKLLKDNPDPSVEIRAGAGRFFARRGEKEKAGEQGEAILKVVPNHTAGLFLKAEGLLAKNQIDEARALFGKAAAAERDAQFFDGLGRANEEKGKLSDGLKAQGLAIEAYRQAIAIDPKMFNPHAGIGRILILQKNFKDAVAPLREANALDPKDADVMFLVGTAFYSMRELDPAHAKSAMNWLKSSTSLNPNNGEAYFYMGIIQGESNQGKEAISNLEKAKSMAYSNEKTGKAVWWIMECLYRLGEIHKQLANYQAAYEAWDAWRVRNPPQGARLTQVLKDLATTLKPR